MAGERTTGGPLLEARLYSGFTTFEERASNLATRTPQPQPPRKHDEPPVTPGVHRCGDHSASR